MFRQARLRLTLAYAGLFFALVSVLIAAAYFTLAVTIDQQIDDDLADAAQQLRRELRSSLPTGSSTPEEAGSALRPRSFVLALTEYGDVISNPQNVERSDEYSSFAAKVLASEDERLDTLVVSGRKYRLFGIALLSEGGDGVVVISARDLSFRDDRVRLLVIVFAAAGGAGLPLSLVAGWVIAGNALQPMQRAYDLQEQFVADASHELRAPVTIIRTAAELILRGRATDDATRESVEQIHDTAVDAGLLIDDMLSLARLPRPVQSGDPLLVDLAGIAALELARMRPSLEEHHVGIDASLASAPVAIGAREVGEIVRAVLENVLHHTPAGTQIELSSGIDGPRAYFAIDDNGPGVPQEELPTIFRRFAQISDARTPQAGRGAGLGLAIVAEIVQRHEGTVHASPSHLGGLRIEVSFPT